MASDSEDEVLYFATPEVWRTWLHEHHQGRGFLWVGFYKKGSGRPSLSWPESVDEALCYGWIDGLRRNIDGDSYKIRFTPRRANSTWSAVNLKRIEELLQQGRMQKAGLDLYLGRQPENAGQYSYERKTAQFSPSQAAQLRANPSAWEYFSARSPSYQKAATWWVVSAKKEETQQRRLQTLIEDSAQRRSLRQLAKPGTA